MASAAPLMEKPMEYITLLTNYVHSKVLAFLIILIVGFGLARLIAVCSRKYLFAITGKTKTEIDDMILQRSEKPLFYIILVVVLEISLIPLQLTNPNVDKFLNTIVVILLTCIVIVIFDIIIDVWGANFAQRTKSAMDNAVLPLIHKFSKVFIGIIGLIFIFDLWGVEISPLLASLGIAGIAVAFALQNTLGNIFGGVSIILDKSVKVGDRLKLENGTTGIVRDVGLRSTKIESFDNELIIVPNGKLADSQIQNLALPDPSVRVIIDFGVEYGSDPEKVRKVVLGIVKKFDTLNKKEKEPKVWLMEMGDFALKFRTIFWVKSYQERFLARVAATEEIYRALNKAKIGIAFPTSTVYLKKRK